MPLRIAPPPSAHWVDRVGIALSLLCAAHCALVAVLIAFAAGVGSWLGGHAVHQVGLLIAIVLGVSTVTFRGSAAYNRPFLAPAAAGLALMGGALLVPHSMPWLEIVMTVLGAGLLALAHLRNMAPRHRAGSTLGSVSPAA